MFNIYLIFANIILLITLFSVCYVWYIIYKNNTTVNLYKYKIVSFTKTCCIIIFYIFIFIFLMYYLRINNFGKYLDIKELYSTFTFYYTLFIKPLSIYHKSYIFSLAFLIILLLSLVFRLIIIKTKLELFKFYIFIINKPRSGLSQRRAYKIKDFFIKFKDLDFLSYYTFKYIIKMFEWLPQTVITNKIKDNLKFFFYNKTIYKKIYNLFIKLTPLFVILYDCIFNNFIIIHVYYYFLIYIPLMLFLKITEAMAQTNEGFTDILWQIYYNNKDNNIKYIANKQELELIYAFSKVNASYIIDLCLDMVEFSLQNAITYHLQDTSNKIYINNNCTYLKIDSHNIFIVTEDEQGNYIFTETKDYTLL